MTNLPSSLAVLAALLASCLGQPATAREVDVTLSPQIANGPLTGRIYVLLTKSSRSEPRFGPNWFDPEPFFRVDVKNMQPGETVRLDETSAGFPKSLSTVPPGEYRVQAVLDHSFYSHQTSSPGNLYSPVATWTLTGDASEQPLHLTLDQVVPDREFPETMHVKELRLLSPLLSKFHQRQVLEYAAVVLPRSYFAEPEKRYPVIYSIPGFGGSHRDALAYRNGPPPPGEGEVEFIRVFLSGDCQWGHHVYANSETNGPRGDALVQELVPHIDRAFRTVAAPTARFLTGHSSGGWASLWLQINYPKTFGGVWSTAPDPVDFRDFQQINIYADPPQSAYVDPQGQRRPLARRGQQPVLWFDSFCKMDDVLGRGCQLRSFEAVFSPLGEDGLPLPLWDRESGKINPAVAKAWEEYDISLILQRNWDQLRPNLQGKIHVYMGTLDTFYLNGATELLKVTLQEQGSDATVTIVQGASHSSLLTPQLFAEIRRQMSAAYLAAHGNR